MRLRSTIVVSRNGARVRCLALAGVLAAGLSCGRGNAPAGTDTAVETESAPDSVSGVAAPPTAADSSSGDGWTSGITTDSFGAAGTGIVTALRTGTHAGFDRITLEFGPGASLPGYHIEYIDRPLHECGSGRQIHPVGDAWLEIRLEGAAAHTEAGEPTLPNRETTTSGALLRRIYRTCDFEGVVTFVAALSAPGPYRVLQLAQPPRLVIDIRH